MSATPSLEFWFEFGSNYSYLSVMRIEAAAARRQVAVHWKPFLLGPIFKSFGWDTSPFVLQEAKGRYVWQDMVRQCRKYGLPWTRPGRFPRSALHPSRVAVAFADAVWIGEFCRRVMLMNFAEDRDIDTPEAVAEVLLAMGLPARTILDEAASPAMKPRLRLQTEEAKARGIFGAPTFFVGEAMYWGNDRLDDAIEDAAALRAAG